MRSPDMSRTAKHLSRVLSELTDAVNVEADQTLVNIYTGSGITLPDGMTGASTVEGLATSRLKIVACVLSGVKTLSNISTHLAAQKVTDPVGFLKRQETKHTR